MSTFWPIHQFLPKLLHSDLQNKVKRGHLGCESCHVANRMEIISISSSINFELTPLKPPKNARLDFELIEQKMCHRFSVEFHGESNDNSFKAQKLNHYTFLALIGPNWT